MSGMELFLTWALDCPVSLESLVMGERTLYLYATVKKGLSGTRAICTVFRHFHFLWCTPVFAFSSFFLLFDAFSSALLLLLRLSCFIFPVVSFCSLRLASSHCSIFLAPFLFLLYSFTFPDPLFFSSFPLLCS